MLDFLNVYLISKNGPFIGFHERNEFHVYTTQSKSKKPRLEFFNANAAQIILKWLLLLYALPNFRKLKDTMLIKQAIPELGFEPLTDKPLIKHLNY